MRDDIANLDEVGDIGAIEKRERKRYGSDMVVFGFAFNQRSFQAMEMPFGSGKGLRSFEVKPAPEGSLDAMLAAAGLPFAAIDLRAVPKDGPVASWFSQPRAMIRRTPGPHYGETFGRLAQTIDAKPFQGQRIKLRAAVRTDVAGPGNQAHLWLRVHKKGFGPDSVAFSDNMPDRPIMSPQWRVFEIVGDVSKDAQTINFGLALVGEGKAWLDSVSLEVVGK